jgi:hypothetical protein
MPDLDAFLAACPRNANYMSWKIQNEFIDIVDKLVVEEIVKPVIRDKKPFSIIMDETTNASTKLQVAISISGSIVDDLPSNSAPCNVLVKTALPSQRKRRPPADLSNFVVMHAMPIFSSTARRSATLTLAEYYEILYMAKQEIDARFDNPVLGTLAALQSGQMTTTLAEFCSLRHRDPEIVGRQLQFTHLALKTNKPDYRCSLPDLFRFSSVQPELHYIVDVALTLPVTSASAERAFSRLRLVKNHLRTTMSSGRLQSLLRISANSSTSFSISLDSMVELFAKSERKILV